MTHPEPYQGMSKAVLAKLLAYIAAFDQRLDIGEAQVEAWHAIAVEYRWTYAEAEVQVRKFFANNTTREFLDVGTLNGLIRRSRQDRLSREAAPPRPQGQPADGDFVPVGDDPHWGARNSPELEKIHAVCLPFTCEYCGQKPGERCMNKITKNGTKIPHLSRLKQAGVSRSYP